MDARAMSLFIFRVLLSCAGTRLLHNNQNSERLWQERATSSATLVRAIGGRWRTEFGGDEINLARLGIQRHGSGAGLSLKGLFEDNTRRTVFLHDCEGTVTTVGTERLHRLRIKSRAISTGTNGNRGDDLPVFRIEDHHILRIPARCEEDVILRVQCQPC